jgi:DNA polymerase-3 subunit epsilon
MTHELVKKLKEKCEEIGCDQLQIQWMEEHRCERRYVHHHIDARMIECQIPEDEIDKAHPLYGKKVVFTGALVRFKRDAAMQLVANLGGINQNGVTKETDFLVLGNNDYCRTIKDGKSSKQKKAEEYMLKGTGISIMDEQTFYDMIEAGDD